MIGEERAPRATPKGGNRHPQYFRRGVQYHRRPGIPEIIDTRHQPVAVPYGKNQQAFMFERQPEEPVTLAPGAFASFLIGFNACEDGASPSCISEAGEEISLPGDDTWLRISGSFPQGGRWEGFDVSSVRAGRGADAPPQWQPPTAPVAVAGGSLPQVEVALQIPQAPEAGPGTNFTAHLTLRNRGAAPEAVDWDHCVINERLTNSAGKAVPGSQPCPASMGPIGADGKLAPGAIASKDFIEPAGGAGLSLCREGTWH